MRPTPKFEITPLGKLSVKRYQILAHGLIPNTAIQNRPVYLYNSVFPMNSTAGDIESHLRSQGIVQPQWRYTMYNETHFHSNTHEVLCVSTGAARLCFGGEDNPGKVERGVKKGDVIILPAGVGHRLLEDLTGDFDMVGSYPVGGPRWDMCYGREGEEEKIKGIERLKWFDRDPIYGDKGPVVESYQNEFQD